MSGGDLGHQDTRTRGWGGAGLLPTAGPSQELGAEAGRQLALSWGLQKVTGTPLAPVPWECMSHRRDVEVRSGQ